MNLRPHTERHLITPYSVAFAFCAATMSVAFIYIPWAIGSALWVYFG